MAMVPRGSQPFLLLLLDQCLGFAHRIRCRKGTSKEQARCQEGAVRGGGWAAGLGSPPAPHLRCWSQASLLGEDSLLPKK